MKIKIFIVVLLIAGLVYVLYTSSPGPEALLGTWIDTKNKTTLTFNEDGTWEAQATGDPENKTTWVIYPKELNTWGTYELFDNMITMNYSSAPFPAYSNTHHISYSRTELSIEVYEDDVREFTKAEDGEKEGASEGHQEEGDHETEGAHTDDGSHDEGAEHYEAH